MSTSTSTFDIDKNLYELYTLFLAVVGSFGSEPDLLDIIVEIKTFYRATYLARKWSSLIGTSDYNKATYETFKNSVVPKIVDGSEDIKLFFQGIETKFATLSTINDQPTYEYKSGEKKEFKEIACPLGGSHIYEETDTTPTDKKRYTIFTKGKDSALHALNAIFNQGAKEIYGSGNTEYVNAIAQMYYAGTLDVDTIINDTIATNGKYLEVKDSSDKIEITYYDHTDTTSGTNYNYIILAKKIYDVIISPTNDAFTKPAISKADDFIEIIRLALKREFSDGISRTTRDLFTDRDGKQYYIVISNNGINNIQFNIGDNSRKLALQPSDISSTSTKIAEVSVTIDISEATGSGNKYHIYIEECNNAAALNEILQVMRDKINEFILKQQKKSMTSDLLADVTETQKKLQGYLSVHKYAMGIENYKISYLTIENLITDIIEIQSSIFQILETVEATNNSIPDPENRVRKMKLSLQETIKDINNGTEVIKLIKTADNKDPVLVLYEEKYVSAAQATGTPAASGAVPNLRIIGEILTNSSVSVPLATGTTMDSTDLIKMIKSQFGIKNVRVNDVDRQLMYPYIHNDEVIGKTINTSNEQIRTKITKVTALETKINATVTSFFEKLPKFLTGGTNGVDLILKSIPEIISVTGASSTPITWTILESHFKYCPSKKNRVHQYLTEYYQLNQQFIDILAERNEFDSKLIQQQINILLSQARTYAEVLSALLAKSGNESVAEHVKAYKTVMSGVTAKIIPGQLDFNQKLLYNMYGITVPPETDPEEPTVDPEIGSGFYGIGKTISGIISMIGNPKDIPKIMAYYHDRAAASSFNDMGDVSPIKVQFDEAEKLADLIKNISSENLGKIEVSEANIQTVTKVKEDIGKLVMSAMEIYRNLLITFRQVVSSFSASIRISRDFQQEARLDHEYISRYHISLAPYHMELATMTSIKIDAPGEYFGKYKTLVKRMAENTERVYDFYATSQKLQTINGYKKELKEMKAQMGIIYVCLGMMATVVAEMFQPDASHKNRLVSMFTNDPTTYAHNTDRRCFQYGTAYIAFDKLTENEVQGQDNIALTGKVPRLNGIVYHQNNKMKKISAKKMFDQIATALESNDNIKIGNIIKRYGSGYNTSTYSLDRGNRLDLIIRNVLIILDFYNNTYSPVRFSSPIFYDAVPADTNANKKFIEDLQRGIINLIYRLGYIYSQKMNSFVARIETNLKMGKVLDTATILKIENIRDAIVKFRSKLETYDNMDLKLRVFDLIEDCKATSDVIDTYFGPGNDYTAKSITHKAVQFLSFSANMTTIVKQMNVQSAVTDYNTTINDKNDITVGSFTQVINVTKTEFVFDKPTVASFEFLMFNMKNMFDTVLFMKNTVFMANNLNAKVINTAKDHGQKYADKINDITGLTITVSNNIKTIYEELETLLVLVYRIAQTIIDFIKSRSIYKIKNKNTKSDALDTISTELINDTYKSISTNNLTPHGITLLPFYKEVVDKILEERLTKDREILKEYELTKHTDDDRKLSYVRFFRSYNDDLTSKKVYIVHIDRDPDTKPPDQKDYDDLDNILYVWKEIKKLWHDKVVVRYTNLPVYHTITDSLQRLVQKVIKTFDYMQIPNTYQGSTTAINTPFGQFVENGAGNIDVNTYMVALLKAPPTTAIDNNFVHVICYIQEKFKEALIAFIKKLNLHNDLLDLIANDLFNNTDEDYYKRGIITKDQLKFSPPGHANGKHYDGTAAANIEKTCSFIKQTITLLEDTVNLTDYFKHYDNYCCCQEFEYLSSFLIEKQKSAMMKIYTLSKQIHNFMRPSIFSSFLSDTAFLSQDELRDFYATFINLSVASTNQYAHVISLLQSKLTDYRLQNGRDIGFTIYAASLNTLTDEKKDMTLFQFLNVGLIEYYNDCLRLINDNMTKNYPFTDKKHSVDLFIYNNHYIIIKILYTFTRWFINEYIPTKGKMDSTKNIFEYSIDINSTCNNDDSNKKGGYISLALRLLNEYKDFLADYQANFGQKVSIHMRINDFPYPYDPDQGKLVVNKSPDPRNDNKYTSVGYPTYNWNEKEQVFFNSKLDRQKLQINFDKMCEQTVLTTNNVYNNNKDTCKEQSQKNYQHAYRLREGVPFTRIYNSIDYPDPSVIANYMSLASYIKSKKGALIMTYGYSGVGKTYTLFGKPGADGVLQTALKEFCIGNKTKVYLRVYEIYGLGTQYWYYWNKTIEDFYHVIFHYNINKHSIAVDNVKIIEHAKDMHNYIMRKPNDTTNFNIERISRDPKGDTDVIDGKQLYRELTYKELDNFAAFVETFDKYRKGTGTEYTRFGKALKNHTLKRVKTTVNNPDSSRSIMVYEFKVEFNEQPPTTDKLYVPLIIYDLPGKEDIKKTFIDPDPDQFTEPEKKNKVLPNITGDIENKAGNDLGIIRTLKAAFIVDPLAVPVLSTDHKLYGPIIYNTLKAIIRDINLPNSISNQIFSVSLASKAIIFPNNNGATYSPHTQEINPLFPSRSQGILSGLNSLDDPNALFDGINNSSVVNNSKPYNVGTSTSDLKNGRIAIAISALMSALVENNCLDILIELIHRITGWKIELIYSYFEAYYINENVVGLLQYLLTTPEIATPDKARKNEKTFDRQDDTKTMPAVIESVGRKMMMYHLPKYNVPDLKNQNLASNIYVDIPKHIESSLTNYMKSKGLHPSLSGNKFSPFAQNWSANIGPNDPINFTAEYALYHSMIGSYDSTKIFRSGFVPHEIPSFATTYSDPINEKDRLTNDQPAGQKQPADDKKKMNYPILRQFLLPYLESIDYYYIFYVVSNSRMPEKAEEQIKLVDNSIKFIEAITKD